MRGTYDDLPPNSTSASVFLFLPQKASLPSTDGTKPPTPLAAAGCMRPDHGSPPSQQQRRTHTNKIHITASLDPLIGQLQFLLPAVSFFWRGEFSATFCSIQEKKSSPKLCLSRYAVNPLPRTIHTRRCPFQFFFVGILSGHSIRPLLSR